MEKQREEVIRNVRSCLLSTKGPLELRQVDIDYRTFVNEQIPFRQFGYSSLEEFLYSVDSLIVRRASSGQIMVDAKLDPSSMHISAMVNRQKTASKKKKYKPFQRLASVPESKRWRPNYNSRPSNTYSPTYASPRIAQHNQFVSTPKSNHMPQRNCNNNSNTANMERMQISPGPSNHNKENAFSCKSNDRSHPPNRHQLQNQQPPQKKPLIADTPLATSNHNGRTKVTSVSDKQLKQLVKTPHSEKTNLSLVMSRAKATKTVDQVSKQSSASAEDKIGEQPDDQFVESGVVGKDLWNFTRFRKIDEPVVTVKERRSKPHRAPQYDCKIKVDGMIYSSYPKDFHDRASATEYASKVALDKLLEKYGRTRKPLMPTSSDQEVLDRVPSLVSRHFNGVWSWQVEADYKDLHHEALPTNWLQLVDDSPIIAVEQFGDKYVCRVCTPEDKGKRVMAALSCDVSIPTSSAMFDERGFLMAKITCPMSAGEIWCRQIGTDETAEFDKMCLELNAFYTEQYETGVKEDVGNIIKGNYYAAWYQEWYRVRVLDIRPDGIRCLFVDRGDDAVVPPANVFRLARKFAREKTQAFVCRLAGLEELYDVTSDYIYELDGVDVTLEAVDAGSDGDESSKIIPVVMYDAETALPCNNDLLTAIAIENATVVLDSRKPLEVHVSHIGNRGLFFFQVHSPGFNILKTYMQELEKELPSIVGKLPPLPLTRENSKDKLFLAKLKDDVAHHRVQIIDSPPSFEYAQLLYVDIGKTSIVKVKDVQLFSLQDISSAICNFPAQATMVQLHLELKHDFDNKKMMELLPRDASVLLRVHDNQKKIPEVKLFVRHAHGLVSVNDSLSLEEYSKETVPAPAPQMSPPPVHKPILGRFTPPDSPHNVPSTGMLQSPRLPKTCEYYEVRIPFAVNPWNFFIQPLDMNGQLSDLMTRLQATFANRNAEPVNLKDIKAGNIYAAKHEDGPAWYRVCVLKTIYPSAIVVFYVDYGYYANLSYQYLFPIDKQFLTLPHQAIKAKLAGIKPVHEKWSLENCKYFEKLVQNREYVSVMVSIEKDELYPCDNVLKLKLIDTKSSKQDVLIGDLLIQKKIAIRD